MSAPPQLLRTFSPTRSMWVSAKVEVLKVGTVERVRPALACGTSARQGGSLCLVFTDLSMDGCAARLPGDCEQRIAKSPAARVVGLRWPSSCSSCPPSRSRTLPGQRARRPAWHSSVGWQTCELVHSIACRLACYSPIPCAMPAELKAAQTIQTCSGSWNSWWPFRPAWVRLDHRLAATVVTIITQFSCLLFLSVQVR